jgi:adenylate kinase
MINKAEIIYLGGIPGSGKTTIGRQISNNGFQVNYISSGELKRPEARRRFGKSLSSLDQSESYQINSWFFEQMMSNLDEGLYLIDTHYTYPLDSSFVRLAPEEYIKYIDLLVLVESDAESIYQRRIDRGREEDSVNIDFINEELIKEKEEALRISAKHKKELVILQNHINLEDILGFFGRCLRNRFK